MQSSSFEMIKILMKYFITYRYCTIKSIILIKLFSPNLDLSYVENGYIYKLLVIFFINNCHKSLWCNIEKLRVPIYMCHLKVVYVTWPSKIAVTRARGIIATSELMISPFTSDKIVCVMSWTHDRKVPLFPVLIEIRRWKSDRW